MMSSARNWFVHYLLKRPYRLHVALDQGRGRPVVLLHGIGSRGETWRQVAQELEGARVRVIALDLLGFGQSPKPIDPWVSYSAQDQARAVLMTLRRLRVHRRAMVVGHSMGCFVAVEMAAMRPHRVRNLLLYEPPFYVGLPPKNSYRLRLKAYFALFNAILKAKPKDDEGFRRIQKLIGRRYDFDLSPGNWVPFERALRNAIMQQTALEDLKRLKTPTQIVYGTRDTLVINDRKKLFFGETAAHVTSSELREQHVISERAARAIAVLVREQA